MELWVDRKEGREEGSCSLWMGLKTAHSDRLEGQYVTSLVAVTATAKVTVIIWAVADGVISSRKIKIVSSILSL